MGIDYRNSAYERTVVADIQRYLLDKYIQTEVPPRATLVCEEVFPHESRVPQEALVRVLHKLVQWENHKRAQMEEYRFVHSSENGEMDFMNDTPRQPTDKDVQTDVFAAVRNGASSSSKPSEQAPEKKNGHTEEHKEETKPLKRVGGKGT
jgi:hypothetical protein